MALRKRLLSLVVFTASILLFLFLTSSLWFSAIGRALVRDEAPQNADVIFVLGGDESGARILKACDLARRGLAPLVLVSGPMAIYGFNEADLAIRFGVQNGCAADWMRPLYSAAKSTDEEARQFDLYTSAYPAIRSVLLVTSDFHTARAFRTFRKYMGQRLTFTSVAAPDRYFTPDGWWRHREGQQRVFFEVSKTLASWIGL